MNIPDSLQQPFFLRFKPSPKASGFNAALQLKLDSEEAELGVNPVRISFKLIFRREQSPDYKISCPISFN